MIELNAVSVDKFGENSFVTMEKLLARLKDLKISFELHRHKAVFSVADSVEIDLRIPGGSTRNLFLRDKRGTMFLVTLLADTAVDLAKLAVSLGAGRLSFGSPERLMTYLGVTPGSVTPFAVINDAGHKVTLVLEKKMMEDEIVNYHPLINTMTVGLKPRDLLVFLESCGCAPLILDLDALG